MMTVIVNNNGVKSYTKGAPEILLKKCNFIKINGTIQPLTIELKQQIQHANNEMTDKAYRTLAICYKTGENPQEDFEENNKIGPLGLTIDKEGYINYMYLQGENPITSLYNIIRGNILNRASNIAPNDITILGYTTRLLRTFDAYYRYMSREKVNSMLETIEAMYMTNLNYIGKNNMGDDNLTYIFP